MPAAPFTLTEKTIAVFACLLPAGCFVAVLACVLKLGWI